MSKGDYSGYLDRPGNFDAEEAAWDRGGNHRVHADAVIAALPSHRVSVLELGCGTGRVAALLDDSRVIYRGVDGNIRCIEAAKRRNVERWKKFELADIRNVIGDDRDRYRSDVVCCFAVLKHFAQPEWERIFVGMLGLAPIAIFTQMVGEDKNDGVEFEHQWVSEATLNRALEKAGHVIDSVSKRQHTHQPGSEVEPDPEWLITTRKRAGVQ